MKNDSCCPLVFVYDAMGQLMHLRFGETESAFDYMLATREFRASLKR
ncbi:hypothetical protein [Morganella morganii]|nr:hypothetical protein [Morganella morganii]ELT0452772.1 hypothetical protein [Morganella morganii]MBT0335925.1 hypothetical protein [Morganella morganii subsp. morganii]